MSWLLASIQHKRYHEYCLFMCLMTTEQGLNAINRLYHQWPMQQHTPRVAEAASAEQRTEAPIEPQRS